MKYQLLVVDDDFTNRDVVSDALEDEGYELVFATDGGDALERVQQHQIDVILLDLMMPGVDGLEALRRLKNNDATGDIPVVVLTAVQDIIRQACTDAGADAFVNKPFNSAVLRHTIRQLLADRQPASA